MTLNEAYRVMQNNCGIKVGDTVKVLRKARGQELGWKCSWVDKMNGCVGQSFIVERVDSFGIKVHSKGAYTMDWTFPFFVLEKVKDGVREVTMREVCDKFGYEVKIKKEN